jgi:hypothetical protein
MLEEFEASSFPLFPGSKKHEHAAFFLVFYHSIVSQMPYGALNSESGKTLKKTGGSF